MYKLKIILRYLWLRRITVIPILAAAIAVFSLIVVLSVMNGFSEFIQDRIRGTMSDVLVEYDDVRGFAGWEEIAEKLAAIPGVKAVSPHLSGKAMLTIYSGRGARRAYDFPCIFIGINFDAENHVSALHEALVDEKDGFEWRRDGEKLPGLILGKEVLCPYEVNPGQPASLTTPTATDEDSSLKFRITDHFKTGLYEYDRTTVYVPLAAAQKLMRLDGRITSFSLRAEPGTDLDRLKDPITRALPADGDFVVKTWMQSQKVLIDAMRLERVIWVVILSALLAVAGFCILAVMSLTVLQKTRDIGIIRSMGARIGGVLATFLLYGLVVGLIGSTLGLAGGFTALHYLDPIEQFCLSGRLALLSIWIIGLVIGFVLLCLVVHPRIFRALGGAAFFVIWLGVTWWLSANGFLDRLHEFARDYMAWTPWPRDVFYFDEIPRDMSWKAMLTFWGGGILVAFVTSIIPAVRAARTNTIETLRYEH